MAEDNNFKFSFEALLNLQLGNTAELEKKIAELTKGKGPTLKVNIGAAASSAQLTKIQENAATLAASFKALNEQLAKGKTGQVTKLVTSIEQLVSSLSTASTSLDKNTAKTAAASINTLAASIQKLAQAAQETPDLGKPPKGRASSTPAAQPSVKAAPVNLDLSGLTDQLNRALNSLASDIDKKKASIGTSLDGLGDTLAAKCREIAAKLAEAAKVPTPPPPAETAPPVVPTAGKKTSQSRKVAPAAPEEPPAPPVVVPAPKPSRASKAPPRAPAAPPAGVPDTFPVSAPVEPPPPPVAKPRSRAKPAPAPVAPVAEATPPAQPPAPTPKATKAAIAAAKTAPASAGGAAPPAPPVPPPPGGTPPSGGGTPPSGGGRKPPEDSFNLMKMLNQSFMELASNIKKASQALGSMKGVDTLINEAVAKALADHAVGGEARKTGGVGGGSSATFYPPAGSSYDVTEAPAILNAVRQFGRGTLSLGAMGDISGTAKSLISRASSSPKNIPNVEKLETFLPESTAGDIKELKGLFEKAEVATTRNFWKLRQRAQKIVTGLMESADNLDEGAKKTHGKLISEIPNLYATFRLAIDRGLLRQLESQEKEITSILANPKHTTAELDTAKVGYSKTLGKLLDNIRRGAVTSKDSKRTPFASEFASFGESGFLPEVRALVDLNSTRLPDKRVDSKVNDAVALLQHSIDGNVLEAEKIRKGLGLVHTDPVRASVELVTKGLHSTYEKIDALTKIIEYVHREFLSSVPAKRQSRAISLLGSELKRLEQGKNLKLAPIEEQIPIAAEGLGGGAARKSLLSTYAKPTSLFDKEGNQVTTSMVPKFGDANKTARQLLETLHENTASLQEFNFELQKMVAIYGDLSPTSRAEAVHIKGVRKFLKGALEEQTRFGTEEVGARPVSVYGVEALTGSLPNAKSIVSTASSRDSMASSRERANSIYSELQGSDEEKLVQLREIDRALERVKKARITSVDSKILRGTQSALASITKDMEVKGASKVLSPENLPLSQRLSTISGKLGGGKTASEALSQVYSGKPVLGMEDAGARVKDLALFLEKNTASAREFHNELKAVVATLRNTPSLDLAEKLHLKEAEKLLEKISKEQASLGTMGAKSASAFGVGGLEAQYPGARKIVDIAGDYSSSKSLSSRAKEIASGVEGSPEEVAKQIREKAAVLKAAAKVGLEGVSADSMRGVQAHLNSMAKEVERTGASKELGKTFEPLASRAARNLGGTGEGAAGKALVQAYSGKEVLGIANVNTKARELVTTIRENTSSAKEFEAAILSLIQVMSSIPAIDMGERLHIKETKKLLLSGLGEFKDSGYDMRKTTPASIFGVESKPPVIKELANIAGGLNSAVSPAERVDSIVAHLGGTAKQVADSIWAIVEHFKEMVKVGQEGINPERMSATIRGLSSKARALEKGGKDSQGTAADVGELRERVLSKASGMKGLAGEALQQGFGDRARHDLQGSSAAKEIYFSLQKGTNSAIELDRALTKVIHTLAAVRKETVNTDEYLVLKETEDYLKRGQRETRKRGLDPSVRDKFGEPTQIPLSLGGSYALDKAFPGSPITPSVLTHFAGTDTEGTSAIERVNVIFSRLKGTVPEVVAQLKSMVNVLTQASNLEWTGMMQGVSPEKVKETTAALASMTKEMEKTGTSKLLNEDNSFSQNLRRIDDEAKRLRSEGKSKSSTPLMLQVKNESGQGYKTLAVSIEQATDAQGRYVASTKEIKSAMSGTHDNVTALTSAFRRVALWGTAAGILYGATKALRDMISLMTEVETSVIKVGKVMDSATANFESFKNTVTSTAIRISTTFGVAIQDVLKSMFTFAQQGLDMPAVEQLSEMIALAENVTNLSATDATEALTAAMKQFNFEATDSLKILDAWNEIANKTAIEEDVLANATKKAATAAVNAGVSFDQFNGMVAAIGSATRQSGEQVGTGLRSIFQRINRPSGRNALAAEGITVSDLSGNLKGFVPTITELHAKWGDLNEAQKLNVATGVSGIHHYNTFLTLMEHFDDFLNDTAVSANSQGSAMRENAKVMETAAKQYAVLKEKVKDAGLELSSAFLPVIKGVISVAGGMVGVFSSLPDSFKLVASGLLVMSVASMRFGHSLDYLLNSLAYIPKTSQGFFSSLKDGAAGLVGSIGAGKVFEELPDKKKLEIGNDALRVRSIAEGDFAKGGAQKLLSSPGTYDAATGAVIGASANLGDMTKFSAAVRGIKVDDKVLGIKDMNSVISKLGLTMAIAGQSIAGWSASLFKADAAAVSASVASKGFLVSLLPLAGALAAVGLVIWGVSKAYSAITDRGDEISKSFDSQVAGLEENLKAARAASIAFDGLANARDKLAKSANEADASTNPVKIARNAGLAGALPDTEKKAFLSAKGISSGAIEGMDEYGRVTLKSNEALKVLSHSAVESAATHLSLVKAQQASALAAELTTRKWYQTSSAMERYKDSVKTLISFDRELKEGTKSIQGIDLNNEAFSGGKKIFSEMQKDIVKARGKLAEFEMEFKRIINSMPKETSIDFFAGMPHIEEQAKILEALAAVSNRNAAPGEKAATKIDALNALVASVKTGIKDLDPLAERSFRKLIIKGGIRPFSVDKDNIQEVVTQAKKGTSDLEGALAFVKQPGETVVKQWTTRVDEDGNALIGVFDDLGNHVEEKIRDLVASGANIQIIKPGALVDQVTEELSKIKKITTGAGAGINFLGELKLGARLSQDLTPQEKTAKEAPEIYKGAYKAALAYENQLKKIEGMHKGEDRIAGTSGPKVLADQTAQLDKLASTANAMSYIARLSTEISTLGLEAEKAATKVRDMAIDRSVEAFASRFKLGAEKGVVEGRKFAPLKSEHELTQQERFNRDYGSQIDIIQGIDDEAAAAKDRAKRAQKLSQDLPSFLKDFQSSTKAFKSEGDVTAYVDKLKKEVLGGKDTQLTANVVRQDKLLSATEDIRKSTQRTADALEKKKSPDTGERALTDEEVQKWFEKDISKAIGKRKTLDEHLDSFPARSWRTIKGLFSSKNEESSTVEMPKEFKSISMDFAKGLASSGKKATPGDAQRLINTILSSAQEERDSTAILGSKWGFAGKNRLSAIDVEAGPGGYDRYEARLKAQKANEKRLDDVIGRLTKASPELLKGIQAALDRASDGLTGVRTRGVAEPTKAENIVTGKQAVEAAIKAGATVVGKIGDKAFEDIGKAVSKSGFLQSLLTGVNSIHKFVSALDDSIYSIKKAASVRDAMQELNAPIAGAMKGVVSAQFSQEDLGKDFQDLSGFERATRSAPNTSKFMSDFKSAESQAKKVAEDMASSVFDTEQRIKEIRDRGGQEQEGQLRLLEQARGQEVSMLDKLKGALSSARDSMGGFFDKFRNIVLVEEAKKKIEDLFRSFNIAKETRFNTDSIDRAMGRSPFSVTPTKLGEPRDLNAFQREMFHINKKLSSGVSGEEHSQLTRRKEEIKFDMEEAKITRAQDKEKEKLQQQVDLGKNALDTLAGLKQRGVKEFAGFDISSTMQLLKSQLETAGDIKQGVRGPKGEQYFKGIPLLGQLEGQLDALKNQKEEVDLGKQREVLMKPLEDIATRSKEELVKINENLSKAFKDAIDKGKEGESKDSNKEYSKGIVDNLTKSSDAFVAVMDATKVAATAVTDAFSAVATAASSMVAAMQGFSASGDAKAGIDSSVGGSVDKKAQGGFVSGPSGVDKVPARLTAGEFVISKGGVDALRSSYGDKVLHAINAGRIPKFAEGGRLTRDDFLELIANEGAIDSPSNESYTRQLSKTSSISLGLTDANGEYLDRERLAGVAGAKTLFKQDAAGNVLSGGDRPYYPGAKTIASDLYDKTGTYLISKEQASPTGKYDSVYGAPAGILQDTAGKPKLVPGTTKHGSFIDRIKDKYGERLSFSTPGTYGYMSVGDGSQEQPVRKKDPWYYRLLTEPFGPSAPLGSAFYSESVPFPKGTTEPGLPFRRTPLSYRSAALLDDTPSSQSRGVVVPPGGLLRDAGPAGGTGFRAPRSQVPSPVFAPDRDAGVPSTVSYTTRDAGVSDSSLRVPQDSRAQLAGGSGFRAPRSQVPSPIFAPERDAGVKVDNKPLSTSALSNRPSAVESRSVAPGKSRNIRQKRFNQFVSEIEDRPDKRYLAYFSELQGHLLGTSDKHVAPPRPKWVSEKEVEKFRRLFFDVANPFSEDIDYRNRKYSLYSQLQFDYDRGKGKTVIEQHNETDELRNRALKGTLTPEESRYLRNHRNTYGFEGKNTFKDVYGRNRGLFDGYKDGGLVEEDNKYLSQEEGKKLIDDILTRSTNMHVDAYSASQKPSGLSEDKEGQKYLYEQAVKHHNFMGGVKFSGEGDSQTIQLGGKFFPASRESSDFLRAQLAETQGILNRLAGEKEARNKSPILSSLTSGEFAKEKGLGVVSDTLLRSVAKPIAGAAEFFGGIAGSAGESLDVALKGGLADPLLSRKGFGARLTVAGGLGAAAFGAAALPGAALATIGKGAQFGFSALGAYTGGTHIGTGLEKIVSSGKVGADSLSDILGGAGGVALSVGPFLNMAKGMGGKYTPPSPYKPPASYIKRMRDLGEEGPSVGSEGLGIAKVLEEEALKAAAARAKTIEAMPAYEKSLEEGMGASREYFRRAAREAESVGPKPLGGPSAKPYTPPRWYTENKGGFGDEVTSLPKEIEIVKALEAEDKVLKASKVGGNDALWHDLKKSHPDVFSKPPSVPASGSIDVPGPRLPTWIDELRARLKNDPEFERSALERETLNKIKEAKGVKPYSKPWLNKLRDDLRIDEGALGKQAEKARETAFRAQQERLQGYVKEEFNKPKSLYSEEEMPYVLDYMAKKLEKDSEYESVGGLSLPTSISEILDIISSGIRPTKVGDVIGEKINAGVPGTFSLSAQQLSKTKRGPIEGLILSKAEEEAALKRFLSGGAESPMKAVSFSPKQLESLSIEQIKDKIARSVDEHQRVDLSGIPGRRRPRKNSDENVTAPLEKVGRRAFGGPISGPGGPTSDIIPILASNGEYVINAKSVKSLGLERLEYLNNHGKLPKFAEGGLVGSKGSSNQQVEIDPSIIAKAIEEAFSSAGQKFSDTVSKIEIPFKVPEDMDLTIKPPESTDFLTLKAPDGLDLTIKPPESTDFLTLKVPEMPTLKLPEMPTLKLPDNIPELKITGGPGAARLDAIESSLDIIRENLSGVQKTVETSQETFMSNSGVMDIVSNMLQEYHGNSMTELNERFSSTEQNLKSSLSGVAERLSADFSSELLNVESKVTQVSSVAQSALSRSMLRG